MFRNVRTTLLYCCIGLYWVQTRLHPNLMMHLFARQKFAKMQHNVQSLCEETNQKWVIFHRNPKPKALVSINCVASLALLGCGNLLLLTGVAVVLQNFPRNESPLCSGGVRFCCGAPPACRPAALGYRVPWCHSRTLMYAYFYSAQPSLTSAAMWLPLQRGIFTRQVSP